MIIRKMFVFKRYATFYNFSMSHLLNKLASVTSIDPLITISFYTEQNKTVTDNYYISFEIGVRNATQIFKNDS